MRMGIRAVLVNDCLRGHLVPFFLGCVLEIFLDCYCCAGEMVSTRLDFRFTDIYPDSSHGSEMSAIFSADPTCAKVEIAC